MSLKVELQVAYVANATPLRFDYSHADAAWRITPLAAQDKVLLPS